MPHGRARKRKHGVCSASVRYGRSEVVSGRTPANSRQIAVLTRSMLGVLDHIALQVEVPASDIVERVNVPTIGTWSRGRSGSSSVAQADQTPGTRAFVATE